MVHDGEKKTEDKGYDLRAFCFVFYRYRIFSYFNDQFDGNAGASLGNMAKGYNICYHCDTTDISLVFCLN